MIFFFQSNREDLLWFNENPRLCCRSTWRARAWRAARARACRCWSNAPWPSRWPWPIAWATGAAAAAASGERSGGESGTARTSPSRSTIRAKRWCGPARPKSTRSCCPRGTTTFWATSAATWPAGPAVLSSGWSPTIIRSARSTIISFRWAAFSFQIGHTKWNR